VPEEHTLLRIFLEGRPASTTFAGVERASLDADSSSMSSTGPSVMAASARRSRHDSRLMPAADGTFEQSIVAKSGEGGVSSQYTVSGLAGHWQRLIVRVDRPSSDRPRWGLASEYTVSEQAGHW
jgi:hypothetical protein